MIIELLKECPHETVEAMELAHAMTRDKLLYLAIECGRRGNMFGDGKLRSAIYKLESNFYAEMRDRLADPQPPDDSDLPF